MIIHEGDRFTWSCLDYGIIENRPKVVLFASLAGIVEVVVQWDVKECELSGGKHAMRRNPNSHDAPDPRTP